jgi:polysaccharide pyruvyl transferase WcaK-like protein
MINLFCIRPIGLNVGNDAIYVGQQHFLSEAFGRVVNLISIPATSRYQSYVGAGLTAGNIYEINQYGHGVIVGGGNLYENGELDVTTNALGTLEAPLMLFSLGSGRVYNRENKLVPRTDAMPAATIKALNDRADISLVRDDSTGRYLQSIGAEKAIVGGCPTLFLDKIVPRLPELGDIDHNTVLISVRNPSVMSVPLQRKATVYKDISEIIEFLKGEGHEDIRILCHDVRDLAFAASFPEIEYVYTGDVYTYLAMLNACALCVSYRLHATLPCLSFGRPVINIGYDERAISMMDTVGFGSWTIDMVREPDVMSQVRDRYSRLDELKTMRAEAEPIWQDLYDIMSGAFESFAEQVTAYEAISGSN